MRRWLVREGIAKETTLHDTISLREESEAIIIIENFYLILEYS